MLFDADVLLKKYFAVTHVDGTARPQTVTKEMELFMIFFRNKKIKKITCLFEYIFK